jgi:hypothetical protein
MKHIQAVTIAAALAFTAIGAHAEDKMGGMTKMQSDKMASCQKMTKQAMAKDAECVKLSAMHDAMAKKDNMGKGGAMAPKGAM